jgi:hypothetical protein
MLIALLSKLFADKTAIANNSALSRISLCLCASVLRGFDFDVNIYRRLTHPIGSNTRP